MTPWLGILISLVMTFKSCNQNCFKYLNDFPLLSFEFDSALSAQWKVLVINLTFTFLQTRQFSGESEIMNYLKYDKHINFAAQALKCPLLTFSY